MWASRRILKLGGRRMHAASLIATIARVARRLVRLSRQYRQPNGAPADSRRRRRHRLAIGAAPVKIEPVRRLQRLRALAMKRAGMSGTLGPVGGVPRRFERRLGVGLRFQSRRNFDPDRDTEVLCHCDEGAGDVLRDASSNGHDGSSRRWSSSATTVRRSSPTSNYSQVHA